MELQIGRYLPIDMDIFISDADHPVALLQSGLRCGISILHAADHRLVISDHKDQDHGKDPCQDKIENRSGGDHADPCPDGFIIKIVGRIRSLLVFSHSAIPSDRQQSDTVPGSLIGLLEQRRPHAYRKFIHVDFIFLCQEKMSQLVKKHNKAKE